MRLFPLFILFSFILSIQTSIAQVPLAPNCQINSGNPAFPFPQFLEYSQGKTLAKYNAEGVTHCDMEQAIRDAYITMMNRARYSGQELNGVKYIYYNHGSVPENFNTFVSEGDGYAMLAAAYMADKKTFDGLWLWVHDNRLSGVTRYLNCQPLRTDYRYGSFLPGWDCDATDGSGSTAINSATDGDFDIALALLMAHKQWGDYMGINDACGNPISYKDDATKIIRALVDTLTLLNLNGGFSGVMSGDIGIDGYVKNGNTWAETTNWRTTPANTQYPWAQNNPEAYSVSGLFTDYIAPGYFRQFGDFLENDNPLLHEWCIHQFRRAEASSDWLMGQMHAKGYISSSGSMSVNNDGSVTTFGAHPSGPAGEDFRVGWRTALNYVWHGNPSTTWNPVTHEVVATGNTFERDQAIQHATFLKNPGICASLGASPHPVSTAVNHQGISQVVQHHTVTGEATNKFWTNFLLGASAPSAVAYGDEELLAELYRQCELKWDDSNPATTETNHLLSTPKYFHGWFRLLGMLTLTGNLHAASDMVPGANLKVYMSVDKTFAFVNDQLHYTVDYRNFGSLDAQNSVITIQVSPQYEIVSSGGGTVSGNTITYNLNTVPGFKTNTGIAPTIGSKNFTVRVRSPKTLDRVCQTATISCSNGKGWTSNEYPNNCTYSMERNCVDILGERSLKITKTANRSEVNPGMEVEFTLDFSNSTDAGWLNGGRSNVNFSYGFAQSGPNSYFHLFRNWNNAQEAYIDLSNYRVSYFMFDNVNKGIYNAATNPTGWSLIGKNLQTGLVADFNFKGEDIPTGQDTDGKWDQRIIIQFPPEITAPTHTVFSHLGNRFQLHKGTLIPIWYSVQMESNPPVPLFEGRVQDDWSYMSDDFKVANAGTNDNPYTLIGPNYADPTNPAGVILDRFDKDACTYFFGPNKIYTNILVEEFDGYVWRRVAGEGPLPGREMYNVEVLDTLPHDFVFDRFTLKTAEGINAELIQKNGYQIIRWVMPRVLVGMSGKIKYVATAQGNCPGMTDKIVENHAWISSDTDSPINDFTEVKITCGFIQEPPTGTTMTKTSNKTKYDVGDNIVYTIDYEQTLGTISKPAMSDNSRWKSITGTLPSFGAAVDFKPIENSYIYEKYTHGKNGSIILHVDHDGQQKFSILLRHPGTGGKDAGIRLEFELSYWGSMVNMKLYENGTLKDGINQEGYAAPFTDAKIRIELQDNAIQLWINQITGLPFYTFSGLSIQNAGYVGFGKDDWSGHKILAWDAHFDSAFELEISDVLPPDVSFVSASNSGTVSSGRVSWPKVAGPVLYGTKLQRTLTGKLNTCPTNGKIINNAYANPFGYTVDSIGAQNIAECGAVIVCPDPPIVTSPVNYCKGATATPLTATGTSLLWYTTENGGGGSATAPIPATNEAKSTQYYVSQTVGGCESERALITVVVKETAKPIVSTPVSYCIHAISNQLSATGTSLLWYTAENGGSGSATAPTPTTNEAKSTQYYVSQTVDDCESTRALITVVVNKTDKPAVSTPVNYCINDIPTPLSATGTTLKWYTTATNGTAQTNITPSTTDAGTISYFVTQTLLGCESERSEIKVITTETALPTVISPISACVGDVMTPLSATGVDLQWYSDNTTTTSLATAPTPDVSNSGTISYFVSQTIDGCESERAEITVTTTETLPPTVVSPISACVGDVMAPLSATGVDLQWYSDNTTTTSLATAPTPDVSNSGTISYFVSQTIDACESERAEITVTTKETAPPTVISLISACVGSTMETLSATGVDLQWYSDNTTQTPLASAPTPDASNSGTISYFVSQTIDACESERAEIEVNILPPPATPTPTSNSPICVGSDLELSTTEVLGATYIWEGPDNFTSHSQNPHISNAQIEHAGMYKLRIQIGDCISDYGTITVDIHPIPTITFAEVSPICVDANPITLSASGTPNGGSGVFSGEEINDNSFNPTTAGVGEHIITYNYTASGCSASKTITIEVQDKPDVDFSLQATACANDEIIALTGTPTAGTFTASPSLNITSGFNPSLANLNQEYTITYEYSDGVCTNTAHKNITVYSPQPPIGTNASEVYTRITDQTSVPTLSANGTNVVWYSDAALTNQVGTGTTFQANAAEVIVNNEGIPGTYTYYAVSTEEGCVSTATQVTLTITDCSVVAPTPIVSLVEMCFGDSNPTSKTLEVTADAGNAIIWYFEGNEVQNNTTTTFIPSQTEVQTYSFEVSQFDATENCESPRATITLRINALPNVSFTPPADVCEGSKVINFDEYKSQTSGIVTCLEESSTCNEFNPQAQGTYTFEYSYTNPTTLCTNKIETQILVRELPTLNFAVIPNMCEYDNPLALTDLATPVGGTFSGDGVSANNFTPSLVTAGSTITIIYSYTDAHTCTNTATSEVQVFEKPHVTFNDITSTCIDETVDLLDFVNPKNGTFSGDGVVGTDFTMALDGTYEITYEITENGCSHSITKPIIVNPTPTVTVDAPSIICKNGSIVIPTKSPEGVNVVFNGNPITEIDPGLYVAGTYPLTFNYVDPVTLCSTEKLHYEPLWVEIREIPTPIVHDMTATIGDAPVSITATGSGGTFEWTNHIGEFIGTGETIVHNDISQTGLWHYCVKEFDGTCYSDEACMTLSVNDCNIPPPSIANATQSICVGESIPTFTANEIGTVTWYDNMHMPIHVGNDFTPSINADETGTFTYFATLINGCEGIPATISLTIHELPSLTLSVDEVLCNNTGIIQPVVTPTGGVFTLGSTEINNIDTDNLNSGLYTITYEYTNPTTNCSNTISKDIEIRQIPAPTVANKTSLLDPVDVTISAIGQGGTLTWKDQNDFIVTTGETMQHNGAVQIGSWNYCVYESDGICESEEACMTYTIIDCPTPAPNIEKPHISICKGEAIPTFIALETDKVTWYENGTQISTDSHFTPSISLDKTGTFEYYATLTSSGENACEGGGTTVLLTIHKLPTISISIDAVICKNSGTEIFPTHAEGIFTIETFINNVATDNLNTHTYPSGIHNFSSTTTNTVTGCSYTTSQSFELREITPPAVVDKTILITDTDYTISAISSGGTLTWTDYNNADMGSGTSINHIGPYEVGTWEYCVTETDGTCVSEAACMLFSIIDCPLLAPTVPNPLTQACINEPVTLSVVGTETIRWYAAHDLNTIVHTGTSYTFTPTTTGTQDFYVAQYDDNCEGARAKISVHVNETQKPIISGDLEICIDEETTLSAQITTGTVQWYTEDPSTALSVSSENSYTFEGVSEGTYTIWTTHSTTCTSEATETILTVKPKSTPPSISGSNACKGESITFTATGSNITWYSVGSSVAIASGNQYTVENTTNTDYTFEATQNTNGCVSEKASYTITVFDLPNKPIPQDTAICYGLPSGLLRVSSEYSHTNFMWYADTTLASIGNAKTLLPPNDNKSHSYFVRQTVDMCTSYATQVNLVRIEQPQPPVIQQQGVVGPSCDGKPMPRLNASGQNITWYDGNDAIIGHDNPFQANDEGVKTYTVYATQTVNSCESNKSSYTFTRLARPNAPTLNTSKTDIVSCEHDRAILYATSGSAQIRWVTDYNTNPEVIFGNQFPQTDYTPEFRKIEIRLYADNSICQSEDIFLTYELKPAPEIPQVSPDVICIGRDEMIATGNSTHMVWIDTVSKDVLSTDSYLNLETIYTNGVVKYPLEIYNTLDGCRSLPLFKTIVISPLPTPSIKGKTEICLGEKEILYFNSNFTAQSNYVWKIQGNGIDYTKDNESNSILVDWYTSGIDTVMLSETNQYGCSADTTLLVYIAEYPKPLFKMESLGVERLVKFVNQSTQAPIIDGNNGIDMDMQLSWNFGMDDTIVFSNEIEIYPPKYEYGFYNVTLTAENQFGCIQEYQEEIYIKISTGFYIPNALAPNNQAAGVRKFKPQGYNLASYELWIFDQWGNVVWYTNKIDAEGRPTEAWDGTCNGIPLKSDTYIWKAHITFKDGTVWPGIPRGNGTATPFGNIMLIR